MRAVELPLVVGVDGSDSSLEAVDWATDEAARHGVPLRMVHASAWERYETVTPSFSVRRPTEQVFAEHIVGSAVERARLRNPDVKVTGEVTAEDTVEALLNEGRNASAVVVGSRGRGGLAGLLLGSVSLSVAARADCPVIVVRGEAANRAGDYGRVVLGVDEAEEAAAAAAFAFREAAVRQAELVATRAWRCPAGVGAEAYSADAAESHLRHAREQLDAAVRRLAEEHPDVALRRDTFEGHPRRALLDAAGAADLVVVGARRRAGRLGLQLGPVTHAVLHHAPCPVAVVPQT